MELEEQYGYGVRRTFMDNIFILKHIIGKRLAFIIY